ncbi:MAG TPA: hypothetical protein PK523_07280 [Elusimicrobiales bacterium]|nr:hypothetical protein [Elusimicrobiales bacterium]
MRSLISGALLCAASSMVFAAVTERRVQEVEVRVERLETRVSALERGRPSAGAPVPAMLKDPAVPVAVQFLRKKNVVEDDRFGLQLFLYFQNLSTRTLRSFKGRLVLSDQKGAVLYDRPFSWDEPLVGSESMEIMLTVLGGKDKAYLRLLKARGLTARLLKQEPLY